MSAPRAVVGWIPIHANEPDAIVTQAFVQCSQCGYAIKSTGGPIHAAWCNRCVMAASADAMAAALWQSVVPA